MGITCDGKGACIQVKYVFVTTKDFDANLMGTAGADNACNDAAAAAVPALGGNWSSWTSDSASTAMSRLMPTAANQAPYLLLDSVTKVALGLTSLAGTLLHAIDMDENGASRSNVPVWTGTALGAYTSFSCADWTGGGLQMTTATAGNSGATSPEWTASMLNLPCNGNKAHLYCFLK
jgi:hypothetical protein